MPRRLGWKNGGARTSWHAAFEILESLRWISIFVNRKLQCARKRKRDVILSSWSCPVEDLISRTSNASSVGRNPRLRLFGWRSELCWDTQPGRALEIRRKGGAIS